MAELNLERKCGVPPSSTIVWITPPPSHFESPAATAPPEYLKTTQSPPPELLPPVYFQSNETPLQVDSLSSPSYAASDGLQHFEYEDTGIVGSVCCKCSTCIRFIGLILLLIFIAAFFVLIVLLYVFFKINLFSDVLSALKEGCCDD